MSEVQYVVKAKDECGKIGFVVGISESEYITDNIGKALAFESWDAAFNFQHHFLKDGVMTLGIIELWPEQKPQPFKSGDLK